MNNFERYKDAELAPLQRVRSADRKAGTVGDIEVLKENRPYESVEIKFNEQIRLEHVETAIQKIQALTVERYYILSTGGIKSKEEEEIEERCKDFFFANGCEIIVNGVLETISYYLRLLDETTSFLSNYLNLVANDPELTFEHRDAWNHITSKSR
jgi:DNA (cytosine-5)-methyltransferase 1